MDALDQNLLDVGSSTGTGDASEGAPWKFRCMGSLNFQKQVGHSGEDLFRRCQDDMNGWLQADLAGVLRHA